MGDMNGPGSANSRKVIDAIAAGLVGGRSVAEIAEELARQGWKREEAVVFVEKIDAARKQAEAARTVKASLGRSMKLHIVMGVLWIAAGVMLMVTAKPERDLSSLGVAVIAFGVFEMWWAGRGRNV